MKRNDLLNELRHLMPYDVSEKESIAKTIHFIEAEPEAFHRHLKKGHVCGSALLIGPDNRVLLMFHLSLQKWLQFGGHADGDENILRVAMRETMEESGIEDFTLLSDGIADVDVHWIPDRPSKNEPGHWHYDIRYIFRTDQKSFKLGDGGVSTLEWCDAETALSRVEDAALRRLLHKWQALKS